MVAQNGQGDVLTFPSGDIVRILLDAKSSARALTIVDCTHVPGPAEPHVHADAHKSVIVLGGRYRFHVGDDVVDVAPGDQVFIPRGVAHDFVVGTEGGRALFVFAPGGIEDYFRQLALMAGSVATRPAALEELNRRHHIEAVDPAAVVAEGDA